MLRGKRLLLYKLLQKKSSTVLTEDEARELEGFFILERIIRIAKAHALTLLSYEPLHS